MESSPPLPAASDFFECCLSFRSALRGASEKVYSWQRAAFRSEVLATLEALEAATTQLARACDVWSSEGIGAFEVWSTSSGAVAAPTLPAQSSGECDWSYVVTVFGSSTSGGKGDAPGSSGDLGLEAALYGVPFPLALREETTLPVALAVVRTMRAGALLARSARGALNVLEATGGALPVAALASQIRSSWIGPIVDGWVRTGARVDHAAYQWLAALGHLLQPTATSNSTGSATGGTTALCLQELLLLLQIIISEKHPVLPLTLGTVSPTTTSVSPSLTAASDLTATSSYQVTRIVMAYLGAAGLPAVSRVFAPRLGGAALPSSLMFSSRLDVLRGLSVIQLLCGRNLVPDAAAAQQALLTATVQPNGSNRALEVLFSTLSALLAPGAFQLIAASADAPLPREGAEPSATSGGAVRIYAILERLLSLLHTASASLDVCRALGRHTDISSAGSCGGGSGHADGDSNAAPAMVSILQVLHRAAPFLTAMAERCVWAETLALHALGCMQNACRDRGCLDVLLVPRSSIRSSIVSIDNGADASGEDVGAVPTLLALVVAPAVPSAVKAAAVTVLMLLVEDQIQARRPPAGQDETAIPGTESLNDATARADVRRLLRLALTSSELVTTLEAV